jgi:hypothetical protein
MNESSNGFDFLMEPMRGEGGCSGRPEIRSMRRERKEVPELIRVLSKELKLLPPAGTELNYGRHKGPSPPLTPGAVA